VLHRQQFQNELMNQREDGRIGADPSASESTATPVNNGDFRSVRSA